MPSSGQPVPLHLLIKRQRRSLQNNSTPSRRPQAPRCLYERPIPRHKNPHRSERERSRSSRSVWNGGRSSYGCLDVDAEDLRLPASDHFRGPHGDEYAQRQCRGQENIQGHHCLQASIAAATLHVIICVNRIWNRYDFDSGEIVSGACWRLQSAEWPKGLLQLPFTIYYTSTEQWMIHNDYLAEFDFYGDKVSLSKHTFPGRFSLWDRFFFFLPVFTIHLHVCR